MDDREFDSWLAGLRVPPPPPPEGLEERLLRLAVREASRSERGGLWWGAGLIGSGFLGLCVCALFLASSAGVGLAAPAIVQSAGVAVAALVATLLAFDGRAVDLLSAVLPWCGLGLFAAAALPLWRILRHFHLTVRVRSTMIK